MLFSFFNTPTTLQKYFKKILAQKFNIFIIVYLNNILGSGLILC